MPDNPEELDRDALVEKYFQPLKHPEPENDVVKPPKLPALAPEIEQRQKQAVEMGLSEIELIRAAFFEFQEAIQDLVLFDYIHQELEKFGEAMERYRILITDEVDRDQLTEKGRKWYDALRHQRADILVALYRRLSKGL